jgi:hypothetical protein
MTLVPGQYQGKALKTITRHCLKPIVGNRSINQKGSRTGA